MIFTRLAAVKRLSDRLEGPTGPRSNPSSAIRVRSGNRDRDCNSVVLPAKSVARFSRCLLPSSECDRFRDRPFAASSRNGSAEVHLSNCLMILLAFGVQPRSARCVETRAVCVQGAHGMRSTVNLNKSLTTKIDPYRFLNQVFRRARRGACPMVGGSRSPTRKFTSHANSKRRAYERVLLVSGRAVV